MMANVKLKKNSCTDLNQSLYTRLLLSGTRFFHMIIIYILAKKLDYSNYIIIHKYQQQQWSIG